MLEKSAIALVSVSIVVVIALDSDRAAVTFLVVVAAVAFVFVIMLEVFAKYSHFKVIVFTMTNQDPEWYSISQTIL